jgi:NitT/TauT family transport system substrate-binding protein
MGIVLQEALRAVFYAPYYASLALRAYAEEGVEVVFTEAASPAAGALRLLDGTIDVAWGGPMRVNQTYAREPNCDLQCFCEVVTRDPFFLIGRVAKPDFKLVDLLGARVATVSEVPTPWLCLQDDLRRVGIDPDRVTRRAPSAMPDNVVALRKGDVDVIQVFEPFVDDLIASGDGHIWYAAADRGPTSYTTLYAKKSLLSARRDECLRIVRAVYRTLKWVHASDAASIAASIRSYFPGVPEPRLIGAIARYQALGIWGRNPRLPRDGYERLRASLASGGFVASGTPFEIAVDNTLADQVTREDPSPLLR